MSHDAVRALLDRFRQLKLDETGDAEHVRALDAVQGAKRETLAALQQLAFGWDGIVARSSSNAAVLRLQEYVAKLTEQEDAVAARVRAVLGFSEELYQNRVEFVAQAIHSFLAIRPAGHELRPPGAALQIDVRNPTLGVEASYATDEAAHGELLEMSVL